MSTNPLKETYQIYSKSTFMIGVSEITGLHYEYESFNIHEEAEQWINNKGKKQNEYTIIRTYKHLD